MIGHRQALIEPSALFQPLTNTLVGPPLNSFEEAIMAVDNNILLMVADSIHNPSWAPSPSPPSPSLPYKHPKVTMLGCGLDQASPPLLTSPPLLLDQLATLIDSKLAPVTKSIKALTNQIDNMKDQREYNQGQDTIRPYSLSNPAPHWDTPSSPTFNITYVSTEEGICDEICMAHEECNYLWDLYSAVLNLPPINP
jgi:hypothetical protein